MATTTSSLLSVGGLATGIDTKSLVAQLMAVERQPENILNDQKKALQDKVDVFNQLNASLTSLDTAMSAMNTAATFMAKTAATGDGSVLSAQATSTAQAGTHTVVVSSLAKFQRQVSAVGYASASDLTFKTGNLTISVAGTDANGNPTSTLLDTLTINQGDNSLNGIAAAINASKANLTATVINDGSGTPNRLVITGNDTRNYTIDATALDPNLTFPQSGPTYSAGSDAKFSVDGIAVTKSSNTVSDVIPGVTLTLLKDGGATSTVTVGNDTAAVTAKINNFVSTYNDAIGLINKQSAYNATTKTAGVLSGDSTVMDLQSELQRMIGNPVTTGPNAQLSPYSLLSQIGITTNENDGTLSVDATKLSTALSTNFQGVVDLFTRNSGVANLDSSQYGLAVQFGQKLDALTHFYVGPGSPDNGVIATRINGLNSQMSDIDNQVAAMEVLMTQKEDNLNKQFSAMESLVSSLTSEGNSLLSALGSMSTSTKA